MDIIKLLKLQKLDDQDLAILNYSNFMEFIKYLPEDLVINFNGYQKFICPENVDSDEFVNWVNFVISKAEIVQGHLCTELKISPSTFSQFINNGGPLDFKKRIELKTHLKKTLISKGLLKP